MLCEAAFGLSEFFLKTQCVRLFHDGWLTSAHLALSVQQFLIKHGMTPVPHPPYSPDLTPSDFFLFPQMKRVLKGKSFTNVKEMKQKMAEALKGIEVDEFKNCFDQWKRCLSRCIKWRVLWRWLRFKHVGISIQFFIKKFWVFLGSPCHINYPQRAFILGGRERGT